MFPIGATGEAITMRAALTIPLGRHGVRARRSGTWTGSDRRSLPVALLAWAVTYGGVMLGTSLMGATGDRAAGVIIFVVFFVGAPLLGIVFVLAAIRQSMRTLQTMMITLRDKVTSITAFVVGLSFFIVTIAVVSAVSIWAIILPNAG
jgi:hypothetical protein